MGRGGSTGAGNSVGTGGSTGAGNSSGTGSAGSTGAGNASGMGATGGTGCQAGETMCPSGTCADLTADRTNCGQCGHICASGFICVNSNCSN